MRILRAIILPQSLLMRAGQAQVPESSSVGAELIGGEQFRREALFPELAHQPECRPLVAAALHQHVEDLAFMIDGAPQVHPFAGNPDHDLVKGAIDRSGVADSAAGFVRSRISKPSAAPFH
jgi:hypothetical protein